MGKLVRPGSDSGIPGPVRQNLQEQINVAARNFPGAKQIVQDPARFHALYAGVPEGEKFNFFRDWFSGEFVREEAAEGWSGEKKANKEEGISKYQGPSVRDWTESDSEAERWYFQNGMYSAEVKRGWEWTVYDSEAQREEAEREAERRRQ